MQIPGEVAIPFLLYTLVLLPAVALMSARQLRTEWTRPSSLSLLVGTTGVVVLNFWLAGRVARDAGISIFDVPPLSPWSVVAAALALSVLLAISRLLRASRSDEQLSRSAVVLLAPRSKRDVILWSLLLPFAAVSEEFAYRSVAMGFFWNWLGNPVLAALLCAVVFAMAHAIQGWRSCVAIFAIGLVLQALVEITGTLVYAMVVHTAYNYVAGYRIMQLAKRYDAREEMG